MFYADLHRKGHRFSEIRVNEEFWEDLIFEVKIT
jgi:hypothetical protein